VKPTYDWEKLAQHDASRIERDSTKDIIEVKWNSVFFEPSGFKEKLSLGIRIPERTRRGKVLRFG
jgi:hypothetical protein